MTTLRLPPARAREGKSHLPSEAARVLRLRFPAAFRAPVPLALDTHLGLLRCAADLGLSKRAVRRFLADWCASPEYLSAMRPGVPRVDVFGLTAGVVSDRAAILARKLRQKGVVK